MTKNPMFWYFNMIVAILGWLFIVFGFLFGPGAGFLRTLWIAVAVLWIVGHPLELLLAIPAGERAGVPKGKTIMKTLVFGITWWLPLKIGAFND